MREPNLKELMESLATEDFIENIFRYQETADTEIAQLLYFMQEEQTAAVYAEICQMDESVKNRVLASLSGLYPLSKHIIFYLLAKLEETPQDFLKIYDMDKTLLHSIQCTLSGMRDNSNAVSLLFNRYLDEIEAENTYIQKLKYEMEELYHVSVQLKEKRKEKQRLKKELDELSDELKSGNLDAEIKELQEKITELNSKKEARSRQKEKLDKELDELEKALHHEENDSARKFKRSFFNFHNKLKNMKEEE